MSRSAHPRRRNSLRWRGFNYAGPAVYVVTICTRDKECLLGRVLDEHVRASPAGRMVRAWWREIPKRYRHVRLGVDVVMPNHLHGVLRFLEGHAEDPARAGLGQVIAWFKTRTTAAYARGVHGSGWRRFNGRLWQRNFHDRVIRSPGHLARVERYIRMNPAMWTRDRYYRGGPT